MVGKRSKGGGYGKPPTETRFRPGQSGNPKGRPRGSKTFGTVVTKELSGRVPITENGKKKNIPKGSVVVKQLINKAASGDLKAMQAVLKLWQMANQAEPPPSKTDDVFDTLDHQLTIANIVRRITNPRLSSIAIRPRRRHRCFRLKAGFAGRNVQPSISHLPPRFPLQRRASAISHQAAIGRQAAE